MRQKYNFVLHYVRLRSGSAATLCVWLSIPLYVGLSVSLSVYFVVSSILFFPVDLRYCRCLSSCARWALSLVLICIVFFYFIAPARFLLLRLLSRAFAFRFSMHLVSLHVCRVLLVHCVRRLALRCHVDCMLAPKYCVRFAAQTNDLFLPRVMGNDFACMLWSAGISLRCRCLSDCALVLRVKTIAFY